MATCANKLVCWAAFGSAAGLVAVLFYIRSNGTTAANSATGLLLLAATAGFGMYCFYPGSETFPRNPEGKF
ncbi:MAG: hypothetical protein HY059_22630 [Proteobacteria bacterium]|nr:hypothetical protein [Pseudomonadota bacterium]